MKEEKNVKNIIENVTVFFLFLLPLFSTVFLYNKISTLIQIIFVFLLLFVTLILYKDSRKNIKWMILYYVLCLIYLGVSFYHQESFKSLLPSSYGFNIVSELLTILKLITPITFIYSLYYIKLPFKKYMLVLKVWCILFAGSIVLTNIFKISLGSYSDSFITKNIFEWNKYNYYKYTASKGYFMYANQVSALCILFLLMFIYDYLYNNKKSIIYVLLVSLAMLMLGTRVSTLGGLLTLIFAIIFYFIINIFNKIRIKKRIYILVIPVLGWILLLQVSPYNNRNIELNRSLNRHMDDTSIVDGNSIVMDDTSMNVDKTKYVYQNYNKDYLPKVFFEKYYPIKYDEEFWYNFVKNNSIDKINYRYIEKSIIRRVVEVNNNALDKYIGISNTRIQNIVNIESDFYLHYYAFGIIGSIILLVIYLILFIYAFNNFIKIQNYYAFIMLSCVVLFLFSAFLTGNIINSINAVLPFIFVVSGFIYKDNKEIN